jgi:hypothetical protein
MKLRTLVVALSLSLASSIALASSCPTEMKKIDDALAKNPSLTADQMSEVKKLRADGEQLHKDGKHKESVETLKKAEKILGIQ